MKIAVYTKSTLTGHPVRTSLIAALSAMPGMELKNILPGEDIPSDCERVLAFGGDGTMLDAAVRSARRGVPLLGVNIGNLGFLTQLDSSASAEEVAAALKSGGVKRRMLLECKAEGASFLALNDVVVKSSSTRPVSVELYVDGQFSDAYRSDGVIVATPTGSTAYSLSAGGPVLAPELSALVVNPVCPHTLHSRPLVVSAASVIELRVIGGGEAQLVVDGEVRPIKATSVTVRRAAESALFLDVGKDDFYERLLDKMNRWGSAQSAEVNE